MKPSYYTVMWHNCNRCGVHYTSEDPHSKAYLCNSCWAALPHFKTKQRKKEMNKTHRGSMRSKHHKYHNLYPRVLPTEQPAEPSEQLEQPTRPATHTPQQNTHFDVDVSSVISKACRCPVESWA